MKCPICGSDDYYEGLYGPNCGNPDCGKILEVLTLDGERVTITLGENTSVGLFNNLDIISDGAVSDTILDASKKLKTNRVPKRKRLKRYGQ